MGGHRIASRYARSLIELAQENAVLESVHQDMVNLQHLVAESRPLRLMLESPIIPHLRKCEILGKVLEGKFHALTLSVLDLITRKGRGAFLKDISTVFNQRYDEKMGIQKATVVTTYSLDKKTVSAFEDLVAKYTGKKPHLDVEVDASIMGGYVLRMGDQQIDQSVTSALKDIKLNFKK